MNAWAGILCAPLLAATPTDGGGEPVPVQRGPEVSGSKHDSSPPLREIPPATRKPGKRVHPVKRLPRPAPKPEDGGAP
jgi:hypothetical protein